MKSQSCSVRGVVGGKRKWKPIRRLRNKHGCQIRLVTRSQLAVPHGTIIQQRFDFPQSEKLWLVNERNQAKGRPQLQLPPAHEQKARWPKNTENLGLSLVKTSASLLHLWRLKTKYSSFNHRDQLWANQLNKTKLSYRLKMSKSVSVCSHPRFTGGAQEWFPQTLDCSHAT